MKRQTFIALLALLLLWVSPAHATHHKKALRRLEEHGQDNNNDDDDDEAGGNLFFGFFFGFDMCHKVSENEYSTDEGVGLFTWIIRMIFSSGEYTNGSCGALCRDLCSGPCAGTSVPDDGSSCTCLGSTCVENAVCVDETQCQCVEGFDGDPLNQCREKLDQASQEFIDKSTLSDINAEGQIYSEAKDLIYEEDGDEDYHVRYNLTLRPEGIVSLNPVEDFIESVDCRTESGKGIIEIAFAQPLVVPSQDRLFPAGFLLAVDGSVYGPCDASVMGSIVDEAADGYIFIESATGDSTRAVVTGTLASYFDLVPAGSILVERVEPSVRRQRNRHLDAVEFAKDSVTIEVEDFTIKAEPTIDVNVDVKRKMTRSDWNLYDWEGWGLQFKPQLDLEAEIEHDISATAALGLELSGSADFLGDEEDDKKICRPIGKPIGIGNQIATGVSSGAWKLVEFLQEQIPQLQLDVYIAAEFCVELKTQIEATFGCKASYVYKSGRTVNRFRLKYDETTNKLLPSHSKTGPNPPPFSDGSFTMDPQNIKLEVAGSIGLKFWIKGIFSTIFSVGPEIPVDLVSTLQLQLPTPLDPINEEELDSVLILSEEQKEECASCHHFEGDIALKSNVDLVAKASVPEIFRKLVDPLGKPNEAFQYKYEVFDDPKLRILLLCLMIEEGLTCDDTCCAADKVCVSSTCVNVIPTDPPTTGPPIPTDPPTTGPPIPTDPPTTEPPPIDSKIDFSEGFPCAETSITLNSYPQNFGYPSLVPLSDGSGNCFVRLTSDTDGTEFYATTAFLPFTFGAANAAKSFSLSAGFRIYGDENGSADGMAFVIHQDGRSTAAIGDVGGNLGIYDFRYTSGRTGVIIKPALVIELDTHKNSILLDGGDDHDSGEDHIHIVRVNAEGSLEELAQSGPLQIRNTEAGAASRIWIDYCPGGSLRVYLSDDSSEKPLEAAAVASVSLQDIFTGNEVVMGFGSGVASFSDYHEILDWTVSESVSCSYSGSPKILRIHDFEDTDLSEWTGEYDGPHYGKLYEYPPNPEGNKFALTFSKVENNGDMFLREVFPQVTDVTYRMWAEQVDNPCSGGCFGQSPNYRANTREHWLICDHHNYPGYLNKDPKYAETWLVCMHSGFAANHHLVFEDYDGCRGRLDVYFDDVVVKETGRSLAVWQGCKLPEELLEDICECDQFYMDCVTPLLTDLVDNKVIKESERLVLANMAAEKDCGN